MADFEDNCEEVIYYINLKPHLNFEVNVSKMVKNQKDYGAIRGNILISANTEINIRIEEILKQAVEIFKDLNCLKRFEKI